MTHGTAELGPDVRQHYVTDGDSPITVVLLHGYPETCWQWRHVLPRLTAAGFRVVAPDYRGADHSSKLPSGRRCRHWPANTASCNRPPSR